MSRDENPYASPSPLEESLSESKHASTHVFLASFLGMQAGGMIGLLSACLAPLRYLWGPVPLEAVLLEDISSKAQTQIMGESIFILVTCLIFGMLVGAIIESGEKLLFAKPLRGHWFLLSSLKIHPISPRGFIFAITAAVPPMLILTASFSKSDVFLGMHALWALAHLLISIYFGERFAEACRRAESPRSQ
jgi:hypothetical protein